MNCPPAYSVGALTQISSNPSAVFGLLFQKIFEPKNSPSDSPIFSTDRLDVFPPLYFSENQRYLRVPIGNLHITSAPIFSALEQNKPGTYKITCEDRANIILTKITNGDQIQEIARRADNITFDATNEDLKTLQISVAGLDRVTYRYMGISHQPLYCILESMRPTSQVSQAKINTQRSWTYLVHTRLYNNATSELTKIMNQFEPTDNSTDLKKLMSVYNKIQARTALIDGLSGTISRGLPQDQRDIRNVISLFSGQYFISIEEVEALPSSRARRHILMLLQNQNEIIQILRSEI